MPPGLDESSRPAAQPIAPEVSTGFARERGSGKVRGAFDVYEYRVSVRASFDRGRYWLMIWNDSAAAPGRGDWWWALATAEPRSGVPRFAASLNTPPREPTARWIPNRTFSGLSFDLVTCPPGSDGGVPGPDGGTPGPDGGTPGPDGGAAGSGGSSGSPDGGKTKGSSDSGGCGCRVADTQRSAGALATVALALALMARRRRAPSGLDGARP